jgi:S-methylmethionine-dependent homocysteine/selenocysteine methylase
MEVFQSNKGLKEAEALLILLSDYSKPAYISFACRDGKTNAGESFDEIKDLINRFQSENLRGIG